jgi:RNA polymerase sigma-70 factor (ECF subfamily)
MVYRSQPAPLHIVRIPARVVSLHAADFSVLYTRYYLLVQQYIQVVSNGYNEHAKDIAQDIFLKLWQRRDKIEEIESMENYLFRIVKNRLISEEKKTAARHHAFDRVKTIHPRFYYGTEEVVNYRESLRLLHEAIQRLPPRARMAYTLKEQKGWESDDIARVMGVSKSVVKQHVQVAAKRIRSYMSEQVNS